MKNILFASLLILLFSGAMAGNDDRSGQAGATELLINPWARSTGWNGLNTASVKGAEAMRLNVAGLAVTEGTEVLLSRSIWLQGSEVFINSLGFSQKVGETGALGISLMAMNFGSINITTENNPEGGVGEFSPTFFNMGISYAKEFSKSIYGGILARIISEAIPNASAQGFALDAGIQYVTGPTDNIHFGVALRNIGLKMKYGGDGLSFRGSAPSGDNYLLTLQQRPEGFELPSILNIGLAYDINIDSVLHRLTVAGNFTSASFGKDRMGLGLEYAFKEMFMLRAGYNYEQGILQSSTRTTAFTGFAAGATVEVPLKEGGTTFALDYSFRTTNPFGGTHNIGLRISIK